MISASNRSMSGFTLIELMIVMLIMGFMLSMVGGLGVKSVERSQLRTEVMQLQNWSKMMSTRVFNSGVPWYVEFAGHGVRAYAVTKQDPIPANNAIPALSLTFEQLFFQPQTVYYNRQGQPEQREIHYTVGQQENSLLLDSNMDMAGHQ